MDFCESLCGNSWIVCGEPAKSSFGIRRIVFRESTELSFGRPRIHLVGVLQTIFGRLQVIKSAKLSSGVRTIVLWNRKSCVNRCAISFNVSRQPFSGSFGRYVWRFHGYPAMFLRVVCDDSAEDSRKSASSRMEFRRKPTRQIYGIP